MVSNAVHQYYVFIASPSDVLTERQQVRAILDEINTLVGALLNIRLEPLGWESDLTSGVGEPQKKINLEILERHRKSLVLLVGILGQRFGSATSTHDSGTIEELEWALASRATTGVPEIKWFFKRLVSLNAASAEQAHNAAVELEKIESLKERFRSPGPAQLYYREFEDGKFIEVLRGDLFKWVNEPDRPWIKRRAIPFHNEPAGTFLASFGMVAANYKKRPAEDLEFPVLGALYEMQFEGVKSALDAGFTGSFILSRVPQPILRAWLGCLPDELSAALKRLSALGLVESDVGPILLPFGNRTSRKDENDRLLNEVNVILQAHAGYQVNVTLVYTGDIDVTIAMRGTQTGNQFAIDDPSAFLFTVNPQKRTICHHLSKEGIRRFEELRKNQRAPD